MADNDRSSADFEQALGELEGLVKRMEGGDLTLEESISQFEHGIKLYRECTQMLDDAQQRVDILLRADDPDSAVPFDSTDDPE